jgi:CarD family transcriptional regulator
LTTKNNKGSFKAGDKVVYPGHGVGEINAVSSRVIAECKQEIFEITILSSGMRIMVPVAQAQCVGLRKVVDRKAVEKVYQILRDRNFKIDTQTWNRRFREYSQKIKTGSVFEIAEVLRDLSVLSADKELSFGEKKMLDAAQSLLVSEISIAKARSHDKVMDELQQIFS